ncbi:MAG: sulfatase, partial [Planctomycetaceae bacterium]
MDPVLEHRLQSTRRHLLGGMGGGVGALALAALLGDGAAAADAVAPADPLLPRPPHFAPRAKRMIVIHLTGSPPNL